MQGLEGAEDPAEIARNAQDSRDGRTLSDRARSMRRSFEARTGSFRPDDPWFEARSRAFWDDALTTQGLAELARDRLDETTRVWTRPLGLAHRGLFEVHDAGANGATLVDQWSGAELLVRYLDEDQALALRHAEGYLDARVVAVPEGSRLFVLPGMFHHTADAREPMRRVLSEARGRALSTERTLDTLMRMELVLRASSRVKASFAYRIETMPRA